MMDDLVKRLRKKVEVQGHQDGVPCWMWQEIPLQVEAADKIDRLTAELTEARELLNWIESNTTLHKSVETGYYVDHWEVNVLYDGDLHQRNVGESIEDATRAAIDAGKGE
jgi:hypothetical protein